MERKSRPGFVSPTPNTLKVTGVTLAPEQEESNPTVPSVDARP
jgi:hypothetical protein